jgi:hypothetical protein
MGVYVQLAESQADAQVLGCTPKEYWEVMAPVIARDAGDTDTILNTSAHLLHNICDDWAFNTPDDVDVSESVLAVLHKYAPKIIERGEDEHGKWVRWG